jgi:hypothetical protein
MVASLRRALAIHRQPDLWRRLQLNGMGRDFSWERSADRYDEVYDEAILKVAREGPPTLVSVRAATAMEPRTVPDRNGG